MNNLSSMLTAILSLRAEVPNVERLNPDRGPSSRPLMKAAVYREYGPPEVVHIEEVEQPVPADDELLVRIVASTVCAADWRARKPDPPPLGWILNGFSRPKRINILGMEFAGIVDSIGKGVTRFTVGDRVFGSTGLRFGAHAQYASVSQNGYVTRMPKNATFEEAAAIPYGGVSALYFLQAARIKPGQKVLIYGASGCLGSAAVQLAKHFGAHVTGVCSTANVELVRSLGADEVIDYTMKDFSQAGRIYDVIQDAVDQSGFWRSMRALKRGGVFIMVGPGAIPIFGGLWAKATGAGTVIGRMATGGVTALDSLRELVEKGSFRPVIGRRYALSEIVEAYRYAESGHKLGNVAVNVAPAT
jgi:NADPH:quinone reductase-like Zn-dependent oxidoreductase